MTNVEIFAHTLCRLIVASWRRLLLESLLYFQVDVI
jgi:hypothetical protein